MTDVKNKKVTISRTVTSYHTLAILISVL